MVTAARTARPARAAPSARTGRAARERGATTVELALYTPLLFFIIFVTVQAALLFLGNQAAGAAAREAARIARNTGDRVAAQGAGVAYAESVGHGLIENIRVVVEPMSAGQEVRATVTARGVQLVPGVPGADITQVVQGPVENFRPDDG